MFFFLFFVTNIFFSFILYSFLLRFNVENFVENKVLLLSSLGIGPIVVSLILYYSFLIAPNHSAQFYLTIVVFLYLVIAFCGCSHLKSKKLVKSAKIAITIQNGSLILIIGGMVFFYFKNILPTPLIGHDILNYAIVGEMIFKAKSLDPIWTRDFFNVGYTYKMTCAPAFSLLLTWEKIFNSTFSGTQSDIYFRSVGAYYGWLIVSFQFYIVEKKNRWLAVFSCCALLTGLGFYQTLLIPHIDTFRIYFIVLSYYFLVSAVKKTDGLSIILFGIVSGFSTYSHRIGLVLSIINYGVFFVMQDNSLNKRIFNITIVSILLLVLGGSHYLIDLLLGQGYWIQL
ncbi:glycosyltransferase family 39 protein [uncultured Desulfobacter sp.]|uniref:glycosyltransferase family 39 protein n=1 Tax=uncultured Desulfobacter sp. TaxID=240139 RepID=UPI0029F488AD|nr:glycosyltransferase family 39 protein [uncultured Desulfobacter sp.]